MYYLKILTTSLFVILADQISKYFFLQNPNWYRNDGFFELYLTYNKGIAFGITPPPWTIYMAIAVILISGGIYAYRNFNWQSRLARFSTALILAGAVGNLIDRIRFGQVVDFIKVGPWPMFNLADSAITAGVLVLILWSKKILKDNQSFL